MRSAGNFEIMRFYVFVTATTATLRHRYSKAPHDELLLSIILLIYTLISFRDAGVQRFYRLSRF